MAPGADRVRAVEARADDNSLSKSTAFDAVIKELSSAAKLEPAQAFVRIIEELVDRMADLLETSIGDLDDASRVIFRAEGSQRTKLADETAMLRRLMIGTGRTERTARIHYTLVCLDRMAKFTVERCHDWIATDLTVLQRVSSDISSLVQFSEGLVSRVQLLQDAATGVINIDQNEVMKVLTIASVVGIPPVLVVGIYGKFQEHAGMRLDLGLSLRTRRNRHHRPVASDLVQVEGMDLSVWRGRPPIGVAEDHARPCGSRLRSLHQRAVVYADGLAATKITVRAEFPRRLLAPDGAGGDADSVRLAGPVRTALDRVAYCQP